jgi:nucleoside recognition membrane protein YjiH
MAKKQKMRNFLVALFFSLLLLSTFINPSDYQKTFQATLFLWVKYVIPSLVPLYIVGNILAAYPFLSFFFIPFSKTFFILKAKKAVPCFC